MSGFFLTIFDFFGVGGLRIFWTFLDLFFIFLISFFYFLYFLDFFGFLDDLKFLKFFSDLFLGLLNFFQSY